MEDDKQFIPLNTPWKQFKFIPYNPLSTPRTFRARLLMEEEMQQEDAMPCYHETSSFKICFIQNFSNKVYFSTIHFGNSYFENDSIYARSCKVFSCGQHEDIITCIDADSDYLVSGSQTGEIKVWTHREESKQNNEDESFELYWTISGAHKKNILSKIVILQSTAGENRGTFMISGGGPFGILQMYVTICNTCFITNVSKIQYSEKTICSTNSFRVESSKLHEMFFTFECPYYL